MKYVKHISIAQNIMLNVIINLTAVPTDMKQPVNWNPAKVAHLGALPVPTRVGAPHRPPKAPT